MDILEPEEPPSEVLLELQDTLNKICSYLIQFDEKPNIITKEQSLVVKDIEKAMINNKIVKRIINGMNEIFQNETYLKKALLPTVLKKDGVTFSIEQESLVRLLLKVNQLQDDILKFIIEEMMKVCSDTEDCGMMRLLLNPLKYLPNINDAEGFSERLLDLLEIASSELQLEMLDFIPDIIPDSCYDKVAEQLLRILSSGQGPGDAIIGCFGSFDFDENVRDNLYGTLFDQILPVYPDCLTATLKLLFNNHKGKISPHVFLKIRDMIDSIMTETRSVDRKISIINILRSVSNKENIIQSCIDVINRFKTSKEYKPFDLLVLLILGDDTKYKEFIRKKIESDHFTPELVASLVPFALLDENFDGIIKLTNYLLRFHSEKVQNFTKSLLDAVFSFDIQGIQRMILTREIVDCLIRASYNSDFKCVHQALRIFHDLVLKFPNQFYENLNKMMGLLRKIEDFDLYASLLVYQIVCHIPSNVNPCNPQSEAIRNEINLVLRKQLMSSKRLRKSKGIMGSIIQLKSDIRKTISDPENGEQEQEMFASPPPTIAEASILVEAVCVLTGGMPECNGMFYDELASLMCKIDVKMDFVKWIAKRTRALLEYYIIDSNGGSKEIHNLVFEAEYAIDKTKSYVMNIGPMALEPQKYENSPLVLLPPLFRLYRTCYKGKSLDSLQAGDYEYFLNCSFMLPDLDNLEDLESYQFKRVADVLYHTINYLKEVVEASIEKEIPRQTFLDRLQLLIKLESIFNNLMIRIPEHAFPLPYFNDCSKNKQLHQMKRRAPLTTMGKKKRKRDDSVEAASTSISSSRPLEDSSIMPASTSRKQKWQTPGSKYLIQHGMNFREIRFLNLFKMIELGTDPIGGGENAILINRSHLIFVLRYAVRQLKTMFLGKAELSVFEMDLTTEKVLEQISLRLPAVTKTFTEIVKEMDSLDVCDIENDTHCDLIMCYSYFLEIFLLILSVPISQPCELMNKIHLCLDVHQDEKNTRKNLIATFSSYLEDSRLLCHSVLIYQIIDKIMEYQPMRRSKELKLELCEKIVKKKWSSSRFLLYSDKQMNQDTRLVLEKYFQEKKVKELYELMTHVVDEYTGLSDRKYHLPCLLIVNYSNFHIMFFSVCIALQQNVEKEVKQQGASDMEHLKLWKVTTNIMFLLMNIARNQLTKHNSLLYAFLKTSIPIIRIFTAQAIPIFDIIFDRQTEAVVEVLKTMQSSTRFLHHLCCQSKMSKNISVISHIPSFRQVLEQLIYKVKILLVSHHCEDAFFLGNLKNKDIHGNTQTSEQMEEDITQENEGEDDEIMPSEDESDGNVDDDDDRSESLTF